MNEILAGDIIRNSDLVNLVGEKSVNLGLKEGVIEKQNIIKIKNILHAQAIVLHD